MKGNPSNSSWFIIQNASSVISRLLQFRLHFSVFCNKKNECTVMQAHVISFNDSQTYTQKHWTAQFCLHSVLKSENASSRFKMCYGQVAFSECSGCVAGAAWSWAAESSSVFTLCSLDQFLKFTLHSYTSNLHTSCGGQTTWPTTQHNWPKKKNSCASSCSHTHNLPTLLGKGSHLTWDLHYQWNTGINTSPATTG
jgi:hypothetical protein